MRSQVCYFKLSCNITSNNYIQTVLSSAYPRAAYSSLSLPFRIEMQRLRSADSLDNIIAYNSTNNRRNLQIYKKALKGK